MRYIMSLSRRARCKSDTTHKVIIMRKFIVKAGVAKIGEKLEGTGAGTKYSALTVKKISKEFVLKAGGSFEKQYGLIGVKAGDLVTFAS